jgi:polyhydroxyalkanoate synthesis repressor PhaR
MSRERVDVNESRLIKKYPNRRLYDTRESRYITLQDVGRLIDRKTDVRVREESSGHDITRSVMFQVVVELEATALTRLSVRFLVNLLRSYATTSADMASRHLERTLKTYLISAPLQIPQRATQAPIGASHQAVNS